jgi:uncharacterized protein with von Willebrand factor type A (vWA) domain
MYTYFAGFARSEQLIGDATQATLEISTAGGSEQPIASTSHATQPALGMQTAGGSGQQMITTLNQEPFDLASWIANQMGLDVQIEEEKNRLNELISAFRKAGYRTLKAVKKINNVAIDSINKQLREKGCEELQEGEKACLLDE